MKALIDRMDFDGTQKVDCHELRRALGEDNINQAVIDKLFAEYDKNKDGQLDKKELMRFFKENNIYLELCSEHLMGTSATGAAKPSK